MDSFGATKCIGLPLRPACQLVFSLSSTSMTCSFFPLLAIILVALLPAHADTPAISAKTCSISGTVVKGPGGEPLKKVLIQMIAETQGENYSASTDANGHFHLENVAPNRYRIFVERAGFAGVNGRGAQSDVNVVTVQAGQSVDDLLLRMLPTAVISGRITDEDGDPMSEVRVVAMKRVPGKARRQAVSSEATNDLGEYRLAGLFPGQYSIVAMPPPDFRDYQQEKSRHDDPANEAKAESRYLATYYPGTYDAAQAAQLSVKAGDEMPLNLTLVPARTYRVRGMVTGIAPGQKPIVELVSKSGDTIHAGEAQPDGQFEVRGVGPGSYVLRATFSSDAQSLTARQDVSVVSGDLDGVTLTPQPSFTISGHLHVEGNGNNNDNAPVSLSEFSVNLRRGELPEEPAFFMSQEYFGSNAPVDRFGNFEWKQVLPGNYIVRLFGGDGQHSFFLKSVKLGGREIETGFTASGPASLDITVSSKASTIEGRVIEKEKDVDQTYPVANAIVVAVPEEKFRAIPDRFAVGESDQRGHFSIRGLAPGSYTLYAWQDVDETVYHDADFLKSQEVNGAAIKVEEGSHQTVELKLSSVGEEWR
jgi:hypothetical protein